MTAGSRLSMGAIVDFSPSCINFSPNIFEQTVGHYRITFSSAAKSNKEKSNSNRFCDKA